VQVDGGVTNTGTVDIGGGAVFSLGTYDHQAGAFVPGGGTFRNAAGGVLQGKGTLEASLDNAGMLKVGDSATDPSTPIGSFTVLGNLVQQPSGTIAFDIGANTPFEPGQTYDQLAVSGTGTLGGTLQVTTLPEVTVPAPTSAPTLTPPPTSAPALAQTLVATAPMAQATGTYVLMDVQGGASGSFAAYSGPGDVIPLLQMNSAGTLGPIPGAVMPPAPPPPTPSVLASDPLVDKIVDLLNGSATRQEVQGALSEQDTLVTKFLDKLLDEEEKQKEGAKGEIVYTDTACKPS
jgi:hypothetical protein